jgi:uncharacterized RDD family membrane protein YckC
VSALNSPSLLRRLASLLYDAVLLLALLLAATFVFLLLFGDATAYPQRFFLQLYSWLVAAAYFVWCWLHGGQTLAMRTWRIRLTSRSGGPISRAQAIQRYLWASAGLLFFGAGFLWALFDRQGLFLHDRLAGTQLTTVKSS